MSEDEKVAGTEVQPEGVVEVEAEVVDAAEEVTGEHLEGLLEDARSKADEHWNQCLMLQAELDNLRKRAERDVANAHKFGLEKFVNELLPVKDSLEMGIAVANESDAVDPTKLMEGTELTLKMLGDAIAKFNVVEVNPQGEKFDPEYHQAMSMQPRDDVEPNTVVAVVQKGYLLNDRLIRPAMVMVAKAP